MYKQILVAIDGSELTAKILDHAFTLAKLSGAAVEVVTTTEPSVLFMAGAELISISTKELLEELEKVNAAQAATVLQGAAAATSGTRFRPTASSRRPRIERPTSLSWGRMAGAASIACCSAARPMRCSVGAKSPC